MPGDRRPPQNTGSNSGSLTDFLDAIYCINNDPLEDVCVATITPSDLYLDELINTVDRISQRIERNANIGTSIGGNTRRPTPNTVAAPDRRFEATNRILEPISSSEPNEVEEPKKLRKEKRSIHDGGGIMIGELCLSWNEKLQKLTLDPIANSICKAKTYDGSDVEFDDYGKPYLIVQREI